MLGFYLTNRCKCRPESLLIHHDLARTLARGNPCHTVRDVWWTGSSAHFMMTSSNGNTFRVYWPFVRGIHRSSVNSPHKCQWRGALIFSLICAWTVKQTIETSVIWDSTRTSWRHCNVRLHCRAVQQNCKYGKLWSLLCQSTRADIYWHGLILILAWLSNYILEFGMKLVIHSQTSTAQPLKFGNW